MPRAIAAISSFWSRMPRRPRDDLAGRVATDADEDMAWALVMADRQWPNSGYLDQAKAQIQLVFALEIDTHAPPADRLFSMPRIHGESSSNFSLTI